MSDDISLDPFAADLKRLDALANGAPTGEEYLAPPKPEETPPVEADKDAIGSASEEPDRLLVSSAEFVRGFVPPDYLWDGVLQRGYLYSCTAATGAGKTALALLLAACTALGRDMAGRQCERGRVVYFAGENADDVRMRWIAMAEHMGFDVEAINVSFLPGQRSLQADTDRIAAEVKALGGASLVIVDTSAAYFEGQGENDNVEMGAYARRLRGLTSLAGRPTVAVLCHPVKHATADNLSPRGGGAFLAEVDGNLTCLKSDRSVTLHWQGKFRGPEFDPMAFELLGVTVPQITDSKGRLIPTVIAKALNEDERRARASEARSTEDQVLVYLLEMEGEAEAPSMKSIATGLGWISAKGDANKTKVFRAIKTLRGDKLVAEERGAAVLTAKGRETAKKARYNRDAAGGKYS